MMSYIQAETTNQGPDSCCGSLIAVQIYQSPSTVTSDLLCRLRLPVSERRCEMRVAGGDMRHGCS